MKSLSLAAALAVFLAVASPAYADENEGSFFPKDYASDPLASSSEKPQETSGGSGKQRAERTARQGTPPVEPLEAPQQAQPEEDGAAVHGVSLIINCLEPDHALDAIESLLRLARSKKVKPVEISCIGSPPARLRESRSLRALEQEGVPVSVLISPEPYRISKAPSWVLHTDDGDLVIEGANDIARSINSRGQFIEAFAEKDPRKDEAPKDKESADGLSEEGF